MSVIASQLVAKVSTEGVESTKAQLKSVGDSSETLGNKFKTALLGAALIGGIALAGIGVASVKMAGDYQASMTRLVTSAGELATNLPMVSAGVLKMSVDTATSTQQLAAGMYFVESAGNHGADALKVLGVAARGAKSENADLDTVAKALTTTMTDYHMPVTAAASAMNGLIITVQNGKTTLQDLSASMGQVLPIASSMGISFPQVAGAIDTMTNAGMPAEQAAQNLAHVLTALEAPSKVAIKSMAGVGLSAQQIKDTLVNQGLPQALQLIEDHVGKQFPAGSVAGETALKNIMGGLVGLKLSAQLTGDSLNTTESNIDKITKGMKGGGDAVLGWDAVQGNFNFKLDAARMTIEALAIKIGTNLLPILGKALTTFSSPGFQAFATTLATTITNALLLVINTITTLVTVGVKVTTFFQNNNIALVALGAVLVAVAGAIIATMVVAFYAWASAAAVAAIATLALTWPVLAIGALIALVVVGMVLAWQHWGQITSAVSTGVVTAYRWVSGEIANICGDINSAFGGVGSAVSAVWNGLISDAKNAINGIIDVINGFITAYDGIGIHVPSYGIGPVATPKIDVTVPQIPKIPHLAMGGTISGAGYAMVGEQGPEPVWLPQGARVIPNNQLQQMQQPAPQSSGPTYLQIDGRTFARLILPYVVDVVRQNVGTHAI